MYYIGIDLGTSAVKLLLQDDDGRIVNIVSRSYPLSMPHAGWSEQNPEDWWRESLAGLKELTEGIDRKEVAGISFGGQMHGLVILDDADQVIQDFVQLSGVMQAELTPENCGKMLLGVERSVFRRAGQVYRF